MGHDARLSGKEPKLIAGITGMPGAGKSTVAQAASKIGFHVLNMGDAVREAALDRNLELTDANLGTVMIKLREQYGPGAIAQLLLPKVQDVGSQWITVDGIRSIDEVKVFRRAGSVRLLAVHAPPRVRYRFLLARSRDDAPLTWELFEARDQRELAVGVGAAIALADEIISNNGITVEELQNAAIQIFHQWMNAVEA